MKVWHPRCVCLLLSLCLLLAGAWNGVSILEPGVTEADTASLLELIETADTSSEVVWPIYSIIAEEASSYFTDSKPVAAVCSIIQNRVQLYLDEQS